MKKTLILLSSALILASTFTACQKNPTSDIFVSKGDVALENSIMKNTIVASETSDYSAPKMLIGQLIKDELTVTATANITIPKTEKNSVIALKDSVFTQENVDNIWNVLVGEQKLYEPQQYLSTKSEIETAIAENMKELELISDANNDKIIEEIQSIIEKETNEDVIPLLETEIKKLENSSEKDDILKNIEELKALYETTPENYTPIEISKKFITLSEDCYLPNGMVKAGENFIYGVTKLDNNLAVSLSITDNNISYTKNEIYKDNLPSPIMLDIIFENEFDRYEQVPTIDTTISLEKSTELVENIISQINVDYLALNNITEGYELERVIDENLRFQDISKSPCYIFSFTREVSGLTEINNNSNKISKNENVEIIISKDGLVSFSWNNPKEEIEVISENVSLLNFDEIQEIYETNIFLTNQSSKTIDKSLVVPKEFESEKSEVQRREIVIDEVKLGVMTVLRQGSENEYLLIPVWDFIGHERLSFDNSELAKQNGMYNVAFDENGTAIGDYQGTYLTINAIDGSVIDRTKGY